MALKCWPSIWKYREYNSVFSNWHIQYNFQLLLYYKKIIYNLLVWKTVPFSEILGISEFTCEGTTFLVTSYYWRLSHKLLYLCYYQQQFKAWPLPNHQHLLKSLHYLQIGWVICLHIWCVVCCEVTKIWNVWFILL